MFGELVGAGGGSGQGMSGTDIYTCLMFLKDDFKAFGTTHGSRTAAVDVHTLEVNRAVWTAAAKEKRGVPYGHNKGCCRELTGL